MAKKSGPGVLGRIKNNSFLQVAIGAQKRYTNDAGNYLASSITYFGFLSLFPLLLLAMSVVGFVVSRDPVVQLEITTAVGNSVPGLGRLVARNLEALVDSRAAVGVVGLVGLVWSGLGAVEAARFALGRVFGLEETPKLVRRKVRSLGSMVVLGSMALFAAGTTTWVGGVQARGPAGAGLKIGGFVLGFGLDFVLFAVSYRVLTRGLGPKWSELWPGALAGALGWAALKFGGSWYAARSAGRSSEMYQTFATSIGVLVLLFLASRLYLFGAEVNAYLIEKRESSKQKEIGMEHDPDRRDEIIDLTTDGAESPGELVKSITQDVGGLFRKEIALARSEISEAVGARVKAVAVAAIGGIAAIIALAFLGVAAAAALAIVMPLWFATLIVAGTFLILAGSGVFFAITRLKEAPLAPRTKETIKNNVEWAKDQISR